MVKPLEKLIADLMDYEEKITSDEYVNLDVKEVGRRIREQRLKNKELHDKRMQDLKARPRTDNANKAFIDLEKKNTFSLEKVAKQMGMTRQWVYKIENGEIEAIKEEHINKLAYILCCEADYLLCKSDDPNKKGGSKLISPISFSPDKDFSDIVRLIENNDEAKRTFKMIIMALVKSCESENKRRFLEDMLISFTNNY